MRRITAYLISFLLVSAVTLVKYNVPGLAVHTPTLMYHIAMIVTAVFLGTGPAILALILSAGVIDYIFLRPAFYPDFHWAGILQSLVFLLDGVIIIWLIHRLRIREQELEVRNIELRDSNDRVTKILSRALDSSPTRKRFEEDESQL